MDKASPLDAEVIELRCPRCVGAGKRGLLGRLVKRRLDVVVQGALRLGSPEILADGRQGRAGQHGKHAWKGVFQAGEDPGGG